MTPEAVLIITPDVDFQTFVDLCVKGLGYSPRRRRMLATASLPFPSAG